MPDTSWYKSDMTSQIPIDDVVQMFDRIPDAYFFIKDKQGRFVRANRALLDRLRLRDEQAIIGTTDHDRYPDQIANRMQADDRRVMETGRPITDHAEVLFDETGKLDWFLTTKLPLRDRKGKTVGVLGIVRSHESRRRLADSYSVVDQAIEHVRSSPAAYRVADLAEQVGVSERHLNRLFQGTLGISVQQFLVRTRVQAAAAAVRETRRSLADIAIECGFCDQSALTRQFRKHLGTTPAAYRKKHTAPTR